MKTADRSATGRSRSAERAVHVIGEWGTADTDPRLLQVGFCALVALDVALRATSGLDYDAWSWPAFALLLVVATTLVSLVLPWSQLPPSALAVLAVVDIGVIGTVRLSPEGSGAGLLVVVPALWLGRIGGWRGPALCGASVVLLLAVPSVFYFGTSGVALSRSVLPTLVAVCVSTAKAAADEALARQRRQSDAILDTADVGLVLLDRHGRYERMNRRHEAFMRIGYPYGHAGRAGQLGEVYGPDGVTALTREEMPTWRASQGEEFDHTLLWIGSDPSNKRAVSVSARQVHGDDRRFQGAALAYHDVTDFVRALRVKDEFVASVSHELRTPLTSINGYVTILLERDDLPPDVHAQLEVVARNTTRLTRLVADLLHTAQAEEGPMHVVRMPTDLAAIVRDCVEAARPAAQRAGVEVVLDAPETLEARVDPQRIAQVVDNLLSNAVKYSRRGGHVRVGLGLDANRVVLAVADDGIGISAADRDRLFTRFFRTRQAEERAIQGVGLGLSITKSIVESHGGRIEVDSELGRGSEFRVRLPL